MSERTVCLVSGGIDSPVAAAVISRKRDIIPLHFVLHPYYCEETFSLSIRALRRLKKVADFEEMVLFPWGDVLQKIFEGLEELDKRKYSCVLCRRNMLKAASLMCDKTGASSITTGEALGQKASQTLENLKATSSDIDYPILRPLGGMDKEEIIKKSKELGLYMPKHAGCCDATPDNPKTNANPEEVKSLIEKLGLGEVVNRQFERAEIYEVEDGDFHDVFYSYLKKLVG